MYPSINIGSFALPTAGLLYIFGAYFCLGLIEKTAVRVKHDPQDIYALGTTALVAGIVGARLVFVTEYWAAFSSNLVSIVWPLNTGYNGWAGLFIGLAAGFFYARGKQMPAAKTGDALIPGVIFGFIILSVKDFLAGPGFGTVSAVPWALSQFGLSRHPVQIYEILAGLLGLAIWWRLSSKSQMAGFLFWVTTAVYSASRLYLEAFRDNAWLTTSGLHIWQIVCLILLVVSIIFLRNYIIPIHPQITPNSKTS